ncbi:hypothetical protein IAR50_007389 [Cryptococcus sp. DSM 104548]
MATATSLQALKVADLKARCKQLKITNYSKLNKSQLIETILAHNGPSAPPVSGPAASSRTGAPTTSPAVEPESKRPKTGISSGFPQSDRPRVFCSSPQPPAPSATPPINHPPPGARPPYHGPAPGLTQQRTDNHSNAAGSKSLPAPQPVGLSRTPPDLAPSIRPVPLPKAPLEAKTPLKTKSKTGRVGRGVFQALIPMPRSVQRPEMGTALAALSSERHPSPAMTSQDKVHHISSHFINHAFARLHKYRIRPITSPPYPCSTTYSVEASTLTHNLPFQAIHPALYTSLSPFAALEVAIRFWTFRLHTHMYQGCGEAWSRMGGGLGLLGPDLSTWPAVVFCKRMTWDVWLVDTECSREGEGSSGAAKVHKERFLILEATGEVIAQASVQSERQDASERVIEGCRVRPDWYAWIQQGDAAPPLGDMIKTKEEEAYPGGISKAWQKEAGSNPELLKIAKRAVLASCALNSTSGRKMTAVEMDAESIGRPVTGHGTKSDGRVALYLPE